MPNATSLTMNGTSPSIGTTSTGTVSVFNTAASTGNLFGAATSVSIANNPTTAQTISIGTASTGASTYSIGSGATTSATTKVINIGNNGVSGSVTNINLGSTVNGATGTTNIGGTSASIVDQATTITIGNTASAAQSFSVGSASTGASSYNIGTGATTSGLTKSINIGTSGVSGSTTSITIGSNNGTTTNIYGAKLAAGTTTIPPLTIVSGTNLTTAAAGAVEYDGTVFYGSPAASTRSIIAAEQYTVLTSTYTLTSQTAAQKLFNTSTNGAVTLPVGNYQFECFFSLSAMNTGSGQFGFALGGAATFTQSWYAEAQKTASNNTPQAPFVTWNTSANAGLTTANINTLGFAFIRGYINVTVAGTVVPQVSLGVANAAVVGVGSYFKISPLSTGNIVGNWS
jgi:hypothetical protein